MPPFTRPPPFATSRSSLFCVQSRVFPPHTIINISLLSISLSTPPPSDFIITLSLLPIPLSTPLSSPFHYSAFLSIYLSISFSQFHYQSISPFHSIIILSLIFLFSISVSASLSIPFHYQPLSPLHAIIMLSLLIPLSL